MPWRLKAPALRLFTQPFVRAQIVENRVTGLCAGNSPVFPLDDVIMCANHILASVLAYEIKRPKDLLIKSIVFLKYNRNMSNHNAYEIHNRNLMCLFATKCSVFPLNELFALSEHLPTVDVNPSSCSRTSQATFILLASCMATDPGPRLNIRKDVLSWDLVKSRSREICIKNCSIALKFDRHFGSIAADVPVKFQSDTTILSTNLVASRLHEILRKDVFSDIETGPWYLGVILVSQQAPARMVTD